jgi:hypothetical protein
MLADVVALHTVPMRIDHVSRINQTPELAERIEQATIQAKPASGKGA